MRAARAEIDLAAVAHNTRSLIDRVAPAKVCAIVKADGYGHGSIAVSRAALEAGAEWLGVALVEEGVELRQDGIDVPILLLSEPQHDIDTAVQRDLRITVYTDQGVERVAAAARDAGRRATVHLKVDTGMNRVGCRPAEVVSLAKSISAKPELEFEALWTHCAVADEPVNDFTGRQIERFNAIVDELEAAGLRPPLLHTANSAAAIDHPASRFDLVRTGIAVYGIPPAPALDGHLDLRPVMSLKAEVSFVKQVNAGESISYGHHHTFDRSTTVATVPIGYADGVSRALSFNGGEVLIAGRRRRIVGVVTMDQLMVDCDDDDVAAADEVVLIGEQAGERVTATEWASKTDTIAYEIVCGIGPRVPRIIR